MTFQVRERFRYQGHTRSVRALPLTGCPRDVPEFGVMSSGCWRGYIGEWAAPDDALVLVGLYVPHVPEDRNRLREMFPDGPEAVPADWFSGEVPSDDSPEDGPPFVLVVHQGHVLLEQMLNSDGGVVRSRLTNHGEQFVGPEEVPFVRAVHADYPSPGPRGVYLDWLNERGDPRAEVLRADIERYRDEQFRAGHLFEFGGVQSIPTGAVAATDRTWFWRRLAGIPAPTPEDESHLAFLEQYRMRRRNC